MSRYLRRGLRRAPQPGAPGGRLRRGSREETARKAGNRRSAEWGQAGNRKVESAPRFGKWTSLKLWKFPKVFLENCA